MHIAIYISTIDRADSLRKTVRSILKNSYTEKSIHICIDGNPAFPGLDWLASHGCTICSTNILSMD